MSVFQPILGRPIRFALVGCGRISEKHVEAIQSHSQSKAAELVAICDTDPAQLKKAKERYGVPEFNSLKGLLEGAECDVVSLCTPSGLHSEQAIQAAAKGRHVITEKPMAIRFEDGQRMVRVCQDAGVQLFVVKQNRCNPTLELVKRTIESGRFGRIFMVTVNVFWSRPQSYFDLAPWRGTLAMDGGAFMNQASHYVDLLTWFFGPVESVQAYTATLARKIEAEDTGVAAVRWKFGALGSVNVTVLNHKKNYEGSITILGEKGTVRVGGIAVNRIEHWEFEDQDPSDQQVAAASYETTSIYGHGHVLYYDNVIRALQGKVEPRTDGFEGLKSLEILIAIRRSAESGRLVSLPLAGA